MKNVDEQIMNKDGGEEAAERAGDLLAAKRGESPDSPEEEVSDKTSWRARFFKRKKEAADEEGAASKIASAVTSPIQKGTSKLLQQAWLNLVDSFGLTLLWIDIHVWLGSIFGDKFFCKLGQEWLDSNIISAESEYAKSQGKMIGTVEPMVMVGCNVGCFFILLWLVMMVAMILGVIDNPLKALAAALGYLWQFFTKK